MNQVLTPEDRLRDTPPYPDSETDPAKVPSPEDTTDEYPTIREQPVFNEETDTLEVPESLAEELVKDEPPPTDEEKLDNTWDALD